MSKEKPAIPKGTRDFLPTEMRRRKYILGTIEQVFQTFGFLPIETPAMELSSTLLGKYGEEGDKLLFRILNSGNFLEASGIGEAGSSLGVQQIAARISEKGLRYDLTVPFARFVVQHQHALHFPFRRYQLQPVWRADKPQKGRYREFYQCDADVIGSTSLLNEAELIKMVDSVFQKLGLKVLIRINNRKILTGMANVIGQADKMIALTTALDKLDKIGLDAVKAEMEARGIEKEGIERLVPVMTAKGSRNDRMNLLRDTLGTDEKGMLGIHELEALYTYIEALDVQTQVELDLSLARGLDYYTGTIIEVVSMDHEIGSLCGGGRYDDLTGIFGLEGMSGVGISFGADRIYDTLLALQGFPQDMETPVEAMFVNFGGEEERTALRLMSTLRDQGVSAMLYPEAAKIKKQLSYADTLQVQYVILTGEQERMEGKVTVKNMKDGQQTTIPQDQLINMLRTT